MEPWTNEIKELYRTPGTYKEYRGYSNGELVFDGSNIVADSLTITQSISDSEQIRYGTVEASMLEVRLADSGSFPISIAPAQPIQLATDTAEPVYTAPPESKKFMLRTEELKGAEIELRQVIGEEEVPIGLFIVDECTREADTWFIKIVAYNRLYRFRQDVSAWYNGLVFPLTVKQYRESLCAYIGVPFEDANLPNDSTLLEKTVEPATLPGVDALSAACEITACWAQVSPSGTLRWVTLGAEPCETFDYEVYEQVYRPESTREDFISKAINAVVIRETEDDIGGHYPETLQDNPYIIQDNFLVYGKSTEDLSAMAQAILGVIGGKPYKPHNTLVDGRPYLQCGDMITVRTQKETFNTYILKRTLKGEASLVDSYEAQGTEKQAQEYGISRQIIQLQSKTNKLIRTVDETVSEVASKVGNDEIISRINQTAEEIKILAQRIALEGLVTVNKRFKILADGSMEAVNGKFAGALDGVSGSFTNLSTSGSISFAGGSGTLGWAFPGIGIQVGNSQVTCSGGQVVNAASSILLAGETQISETAEIIGKLYLNSVTQSGGGNQYLAWNASTGEVLYSSPSSVRFKENIEDIDAEYAKSVIKALKIKRFTWRDSGEISYGAIAEKVAGICPWLVNTEHVNGRDIPLGVAYEANLPIMMVPVIQDIERRVAALEKAWEAKYGALSA